MATGSQKLEKPAKKANKKKKPLTLDERGIKTAKRGSGGPKGRFLPKWEIDWTIAESYYVMGIIVEDKGKRGTSLKRRQPTFADVATKFGVSKAAVHYQSKKRNWRDKRDSYHLMEARRLADEVAKARSFSFAQGEAVIDRWIERFLKGVENDDVRRDNVGDFDKAMRLKAFLQGMADSRTEVTGALTLQAIQSSHTAAQKRFANREELPDASAGVLTDESNFEHDDDDDDGDSVH